MGGAFLRNGARALVDIGEGNKGGDLVPLGTVTLADGGNAAAATPVHASRAAGALLPTPR